LVQAEGSILRPASNFVSIEPDIAAIMSSRAQHRHLIPNSGKELYSNLQFWRAAPAKIANYYITVHPDVVLAYELPEEANHTITRIEKGYA
jgi:hypothetical protein